MKELFICSSLPIKIDIDDDDYIFAIDGSNIFYIFKDTYLEKLEFSNSLIHFFIDESEVLIIFDN